MTAPLWTESLCPVCLQRISAKKVIRGDEIFMVKHCQDHGPFETVLWRGEPAMEQWKRSKLPVHPKVCYTDVRNGCPFDCGLCERHIQLPCSILLEVTKRCNLHCPVCFADAGRSETENPTPDQIAFWYRQAMAAAGPCSIQLSGGEPTMREDLPDLIEMAREIGFSFIQINTNGLRLASDQGYAYSLKKAGLASVFLQFDGVEDDVYRQLRGRPLLREKFLAIDRCGEADLGVVLVPTLVPDINIHTIGSITKLALKLAPVVRGIHFQPISYFGRYPIRPGGLLRITLPEVMRALEEQTEGLIKIRQLAPPGCEHALCSFHGSFIRMSDGSLKSITGRVDHFCCIPTSQGGVERTVALVAKQWSAPAPRRTFEVVSKVHAERIESCRCAPTQQSDTPSELDTFLEEAHSKSFTISCMAFQDAGNLDLERLRGCCISVVAPDGRLVPFCAYNLTATTGRKLYREEWE